jgi:hypothetical protein
VVSLDPGRTWFRYHHLFGDLLRLELRRTAPDEIAGLHRRAATWFGEHGLPVEAVRHAQAAEDWPWAARLLVDHALSLSLDGEQPVIEALLKAFPAAALEAHPELIDRDLVDRCRDENDRRRYTLTLARAGSEILGTARGAIAAAEYELLAPLQPDQRDQLHALLRRVANGIDLRPAATDESCSD